MFEGFKLPVASDICHKTNMIDTIPLGVLVTTGVSLDSFGWFRLGCCFKMLVSLPFVPCHDGRWGQNDEEWAP